VVRKERPDVAITLAPYLGAAQELAGVLLKLARS